MASISSTADRPATADSAVVFACDANYLPYALFAADQIAQLDPARRFDICIASTETGIAIPASMAEHALRLVCVDVGGAFEGLRTDTRRSIAAYLRLALPQALRNDYARLLYLDCDVFVQAGDFGALLGVAMHGRAVAAVRDNLQWRTPRRRPHAFRSAGLPHARYLNSGALLFDTAAFLEQDCLPRCLALARTERGHAVGLDQEVLNVVLHGDWAELSPVWNWQYTWASRIAEGLVCPNIVHFIGAVKPWSHNEGRLPLRFRRAYRRFFAKHRPDIVLPADGPTPLHDRSRVRRMLLKQLLANRAFDAHLAHFETDLTVLP